jgi:hypothetical protein
MTLVRVSEIWDVTQGDLSVNDNYRWMKGMVDDLRALG